MSHPLSKRPCAGSMAHGGIAIMRILALALFLAACVPAPAQQRADVAHGRRLATVMGCISCHGPKLDGHLFEEDPGFALAWSSNLSRILPRWNDRQIATTLRTFGAATRLMAAADRRAA